ncbi:hypothetical protein EYF80_009401 [Liparis tanakae]|uniref:Uncharacterized protein n=1 Tax=Liparis tanakae TaxID=230148 RepID=A0A4Z2IRJ2_9TELE|nr:hypothetical protein EYF80_009401 [Liparis tanakae]
MSAFISQWTMRHMLIATSPPATIKGRRPIYTHSAAQPDGLPKNSSRNLSPPSSLFVFLSSRRHFCHSAAPMQLVSSATMYLSAPSLWISSISALWPWEPLGSRSFWDHFSPPAASPPPPPPPTPPPPPPPTPPPLALLAPEGPSGSGEARLCHISFTPSTTQRLMFLREKPFLKRALGWLTDTSSELRDCPKADTLWVDWGPREAVGFTGSPGVLASLVEVVAVGQRAALDSQERDDAVLGCGVGAVLPRRGRRVLPGLGQRCREALEEVLGKVLREAGIGAGRVVARILQKEALELVSKVCSGGSSVELAELSPVRQRARGGELRATGHRRAVHHWAMATRRGEAGRRKRNTVLLWRKRLQRVSGRNNTAAQREGHDEGKYTGVTTL